MGALRSDRGAAIAAEITTLGAAAGWFRRFGSPRVIAAGLTLALIARAAGAVSVGSGQEVGSGFDWPFTRWDLVAMASVLALTPFVEWSIHLLVLHRRPSKVGSLMFDPGAGHREHHLNPATINRVLLRAIDAALFQVINAAVAVVVVAAPMALAGHQIGATMVGPVLTGVVMSVLGLAHYEWSHFLFHTAYRPKSRYYRRLKSNHRLHHWRNERYWLGITSNLGDRVLRTYPADRSAVPLSPTAKTLGIDPQR